MGKIVAERLQAYAERKAKKPGPIAKTNVLLDVKPWDDETNMDDMLKSIKTIEKDGLVWGANKLVPVGYGINKLQVMCVVKMRKSLLTSCANKFASSRTLSSPAMSPPCPRSNLNVW